MRALCMVAVLALAAPGWAGEVPPGALGDARAAPWDEDPIGVGLSVGGSALAGTALFAAGAAGVSGLVYALLESDPDIYLAANDLFPALPAGLVLLAVPAGAAVGASWAGEGRGFAAGFRRAAVGAGIGAVAPVLLAAPGLLMRSEPLLILAVESLAVLPALGATVAVLTSGPAAPPAVSVGALLRFEAGRDLSLGLPAPALLRTTRGLAGSVPLLEGRF